MRSEASRLKKCSGQGKTAEAERLTLRVEEAARVIGCGRTACYAAIRRGEIPSIRIGGLLLVPKPALQKLLEAGQKGDDR